MRQIKDWTPPGIGIVNLANVIINPFDMPALLICVISFVYFLYACFDISISLKE